jgi:hypothetical protein
MEKILPKIGAVRIDETQYWSDDVQEKVDKIYGVYLFDKNQHTHLCELTPSYCLWYMGFAVYADGLDADELCELEDDMRSNDYSEPVTYMHCSAVDKMDAENFDWDFNVDHENYDYDDEDSYRDMIDDMMEAYSGNPTW